MRALSPSRRIGIIHHDQDSSNPAFTIDSLAACPLAPGVGASTGFSLHATVPLCLSVRGKKLLYSLCLSEAAILAADDLEPLWAHYDVPDNCKRDYSPFSSSAKRESWTGISSSSSEETWGRAT